MPYKEKEIEKLYYSISEVADSLGVNESLIRFWEKSFPTLQPKKSRKGNRLFTTKDIEALKLIHHYVKERGYTLDGARKKIQEDKRLNEVDNTAIVSSLKKLRDFLNELKEII